MRKRKMIGTLNVCYALTMLLILTVSVLIPIGAMKKGNHSVSLETEYVYIYVNNTEAIAQTESSVSEGWLVRAYENRIGIFRQDGTLIRVLDTYIKTLPEADQKLLEEGISIESQAALNGLIEDYTD